MNIRLTAEAYQILKEQVQQEQPTLHADDGVEFIDSLQWPPVLQQASHEAPPNASRYEYIVYDEPEPRRRMARLVRSLKRLDVASAGIYHPTLVPLEDKRIAGVSSSNPTPQNRRQKICLQLSSMAAQPRRGATNAASTLGCATPPAIDLACAIKNT